MCTFTVVLYSRILNTKIDWRAAKISPLKVCVIVTLRCDASKISRLQKQRGRHVVFALLLDYKVS